MDRSNRRGAEGPTPGPRGRIGGLMALIVALAVGLAPLRGPSEARADCAFALTVAILIGASMRGVLARSPAVGRWWSGFGLFGWAHLLLIGSKWRERMPTDRLINRITDWAIADRMPFPTRGPGYTDAMHRANGEFMMAGATLVTLDLTMLIALLGGVLTGWLARRPGGRGPAGGGAPDASAGA